MPTSWGRTWDDRRMDREGGTAGAAVAAAELAPKRLAGLVPDPGGRLFEEIEERWVLGRDRTLDEEAA